MTPFNSAVLGLLLPFIENPKIHDGLKEKAKREFDVMIGKLQGLSEEERKFVYSELDEEEATIIKDMVGD